LEEHIGSICLDWILILTDNSAEEYAQEDLKRGILSSRMYAE
jgi:hypothetical protein